MPRLFSTYTSYLPLSSGVAWRIVSVAVVLPISKNTLDGTWGGQGLGSVYAGSARGTELHSSPPSSPPPSHSRQFLDPRPAQAPAPGAVLAQVLALTCSLLLFPVLGPGHVGRRLTQDLGNQRYLGAFARLSVYPIPSESSLELEEGRGTATQ